VDLSRRIRDLRYAKGWGPDELASRAKISRTALYQIERGNTSKPQAGTLRRISRALGVPLEILLEPAPELNDQPSLPAKNVVAATAASVVTSGRVPSSERAEELMEKFRVILGSPLAEGVARIVEESFRLLPIIPPPTSSDPSRYAPPIEIELKPNSNARTRSTRTV
jgi:transcriptional regulator with XRE-family HTH domain